MVSSSFDSSLAESGHPGRDRPRHSKCMRMLYIYIYIGWRAHTRQQQQQGNTMLLHPVHPCNGVHEQVVRGGVTPCSCTPSTLPAHSPLWNTHPQDHIFTTGGGIFSTGAGYSALHRDIQHWGEIFSTGAVGCGCTTEQAAHLPPAAQRPGS